MSTYLIGFQVIFRIFAFFVLAKLATSSVMVKMENNSVADAIDASDRGKQLIH